MPDDLVAEARNQAERSSPPVRAAARMRIARVQSTIDPGQARITFEMALEEIRMLSTRDRDWGFLFEHAQQIAAAQHPVWVNAHNLPPSSSDPILTASLRT